MFSSSEEILLGLIVIMFLLKIKEDRRNMKLIRSELNSRNRLLAAIVVNFDEKTDQILEKLESVPPGYTESILPTHNLP
jgi:hypothetical protein